MASNYDKNKWELFDPLRPNEEQVHSFITKRKLEHMEEGIELANIPFEVERSNLEVKQMLLLQRKMVNDC